MSTVYSVFELSTKLRKNNGESVSHYTDSQIIGLLLHLANHIRLDIAYAVGRLGRYTYNPNVSHCNALERIFKFQNELLIMHFIILVSLL